MAGSFEFLITDENTRMAFRELWDHVTTARHELLSETHDDTQAAAALRGALIVGQFVVGSASPLWSRLALGATGKILVSDGTDLKYQAVSGDATLNAAGTLTLASILAAGGPTGSATVVPVITWDAKGRLTAVSTATILHNLLSATHGDTAAASPVLGDIVYSNSTPAWQKLAGQITTTRKFLRQTGSGAVSAAPAWDTLLTADVAAAGLDKQIQFNDGGAFAGNAGLTWDKGAGTLFVNDHLVFTGDLGDKIVFHTAGYKFNVAPGILSFVVPAASVIRFTVNSVASVDIRDGILAPTRIVQLGATDQGYFINQNGYTAFSSSDFAGSLFFDSIGIYASVLGNVSSQGLEFRAGGNTAKMELSSDGKLRVGDGAAPSYHLDVGGDIRGNAIRANSGNPYLSETVAGVMLLGDAGYWTKVQLPNAGLEIVNSYSPSHDSLRFYFADPNEYWLGVRAYVIGAGDVGYNFRINNISTTIEHVLTLAGTSGAGRVGIITAAPAYTLDVSGDARVNSLFANSGNPYLSQAAANEMLIGNASYWTTVRLPYASLGIGVTPLAELHVKSVTTNAVRGVVSEQYTNDVRAAQFFGLKSRAGSAVLSGDRLFDTGGGGWDGAAWVTGAYLRFTVGENWGGSAHGAGIEFHTIPLTTTTDLIPWVLDPSGVLRPNADNTYDIGTAAPNYVKDIYVKGYLRGATLVALGGGLPAVFGTIGGAGPAVAAQNTWMQLYDAGGNAYWVPVWK